MIDRTSTDRRRSRRQAALSSLLLLVVVWTPPCAAASPRVTVGVEDNRLSVVGGGAVLSDVLAEIGRQARLLFRLDPALEARVAEERTDAVIEALSPEQALRRLLPTDSLIFVYGANGLAEVRGYADRGQRRAQGNGRARLQEMDSGATAGAGPAMRSDEGASVDRAHLASQALTDADPEVRATALESLAGSGDAESAVATAAEVLARDRDEAVLDRALAVLGEQDTMPLEPVLRFAAGDGDPDLRMRALSMLRHRGDEDARVHGLLTRVARDDRSADVRETAKALLDDLRRHSGIR